VRLSTSTNLLYIRPGGERLPLEKTLELATDAGFRVFDLNFYDWSLPGSVFLTDQWEQWILSVARKAKELGVEFGQCHAYFYNFLDPELTAEQKKYHAMLQMRSLECCSILGARTCVMHPETDYTEPDFIHVSKERNIEYYVPVLEFLKQRNMRAALENMCDYAIAPRRKYCSQPEELLDLVSSFQTDNMGICWDFEHADIMKQNQRQSLLYLKDYLFAIHVSDTHSRTDNTLMHVLPLTGTIDWTEAVKTLKEIGYQGDFSFEAHNYMNRLPDELIPTALKLACEIGKYLVAL
jgi:L-ribulose-5-phosphate 3-epimerase